jgi:hypothetical protein
MGINDMKIRDGVLFVAPDYTPHIFSFDIATEKKIQNYRVPLKGGHSGSTIEDSTER